MHMKTLFLFCCVSSSLIAADALMYPHKDESYANIHIISATFGGGCGGKAGNTTRFYKKICEGKVYCNYVNPKIRGLQANCPRFLDIKWHCGQTSKPLETSFSENELSKGNKMVLVTCGIN